MRAALLQLDIVWENPEANHVRATNLLRRAAESGAELALLPEMFATGFSMNAAKIAQPAGGETEEWLRATARRLSIHLIAGVAQTCDASGTPSPLPCNNALWMTPAGDVKRTSKLHPFSFVGEEKVFGHGEGVVTWEIAGARITPQVCYDLRFPEPFRVAAGETDVFVVVANWPDRRRLAWQTLLRARAIENQAYVLGVNRVGDDGEGNHFAGDSAAISPWGETLASASEIETVLTLDVDPRSVADARTKFSALADRRPPPAYRRRPA